MRTEFGAPAEESAGTMAIPWLSLTRESTAPSASASTESARLALDGTVVDGFEHIVDAFLGMLRGRSTDKIIVRDRTQARG